MPESDLLVEFKLGYGFHFKSKGILKLQKKKKRAEDQKKMVLIRSFSLSQIRPVFKFISATLLHNIFFVNDGFSRNYLEDTDIYREMIRSPGFR